MHPTLQTAAGRMRRALPAALAAALAAGPAALRAQDAAPDTAVEALVLSGGGSRGIAHAGTLLGLERLGYDPDLVVGTSMGALVGALYAAGYTPEQIQERIRAIDWGEIFTTAPLVMGPEREARYPLIVYDRQSDPLRFNRGIVPQWRINRALVRLLFDAEARSRGDFDRLARRYRAVAADLQTGDVVVLGRGDLARAARASMAVPGIFAPVEWEGRSLVDGGIASNLPTGVARSLGAGRIVAVDVSRAPARIQGRGALQVASRALDLLLDNAEQSRTPADLLILPELDPNATGITFPDDPEPLFAVGLAATAGVPRSARRRPAPRPLPGPPAAFGSLVVEAPDSATAALARRVFRGVAPGAYDPARVLDAVDRLYTTGLFEGVWPRIEEGAAGAAPALIVRVEAPPRLALAGAAGYDTDRGGRLWASLQRSGTLMGAPTVLAASASLDRLHQWVALGGRMHAVRISPVVATAGVYRREVDVRRGEDRAGDDEVVRLGGWAGVEYQQLLAQRVASAVLRVEDVSVENGAGGLSAGPLLRIAAPTADFPVVGTTFLAEAEARGGEVAYRRGALRGSLGRRLGRLRVAAVGDVAAASAGAPLDALPALGDEHALPGFRWGEGRGRTRLIVGADAAYPVLGSAYARARVRAGGVADGLGDFADAEPWITGGEAAVVRSTPFGLLSLALQANTTGESRVVFDIGQRF